MLKVAIVGCGKIADSHASQIRRIKGCEIVGVCDQELLMARQIYERFPIKRYFSSLGELLSDARPDVVHVTTPPAGHFEIAKTCIEHGCHVYVEKPFTVCEQEAQTLIALANARNVKITAGHDDQFGHAARKMRALVQSGFLGDGPVHMESTYCYELSGSYAGALLSNKRHWVRRLPGKLLQNIISHGIARIAEHLTTESPEVIAHGFISPLLTSMGEAEIVDELRVIISEENRTTAYFTFSSQMRPSLHQFCLYGTKNGLILDHDRETLIRLRGTRLKSYADYFVSPALIGMQQISCSLSNMRTFLKNDFHLKSGMKYLIENFYRSIVEGTPLPISYPEILLTAKIMDRIFEQLDQRFGSNADERHAQPALTS